MKTYKCPKCNEIALLEVTPETFNDFPDVMVYVEHTKTIMRKCHICEYMEVIVCNESDTEIII